MGVIHRTPKEKTKDPVSASTTLLNLCESLRHDIDTHDDKASADSVQRMSECVFQGLSQQSHSDFIDQCLAFSKECDEATGRADRLLEELSLMRCQSRCATATPAPPSLSTKRSISCHDLLKKGAYKLKRTVCLDGSKVRAKLMDSPMDAMSPQGRDGQCSWRKSHPPRRIEKSGDAADRKALSIQGETPESSTWLRQQLAKKTATQLETPLHVELKLCLDRMAKLELENRALKQLLMIKCGSSNDAGIEELLRKSMADNQAPLSTRPCSKCLEALFAAPPIGISPRKLVGKVSMDSPFEDAKP